MACFHMHGDEAGETHITTLVFPVEETYAGMVRGLRDIPATTMGFGEFVARKPDAGVHNAPRRQFLVVLQARGIKLAEVEALLGTRTGKSGLEEKAARPPG